MAKKENYIVLIEYESGQAATLSYTTLKECFKAITKRAQLMLIKKIGIECHR